jgi:putative ABC transport system ATP-binding protein
MAFIEMRNIEKVYPDGTRALRGVSFDIEEKEFVAIMGPSGSGKSTLLHILGLLDSQTAGTYNLGGKNTEKYSAKKIARMRNKEMGFVFQMFNLLPRTSVFDNVQLPLMYSDVRKSQWKKRTESAIEAVDLTPRMQYETSQLSGGERQRAAIARALVNDPQLIFADEPTGNLDTKSGERIMQILQKLNQQGRTVILITHEERIAKYAKRILYVRDGKIYAS